MLTCRQRPKQGRSPPSTVSLGEKSCNRNLASRPGQLALVTVGTMQGRLLSHSSGVKSTTFLTHSVVAGKGEAEEHGTRSLESAEDLRKIL